MHLALPHPSPPALRVASAVLGRVACLAGGHAPPVVVHQVLDLTQPTRPRVEQCPRCKARRVAGIDPRPTAWTRVC